MNDAEGTLNETSNIFAVGSSRLRLLWYKANWEALKDLIWIMTWAFSRPR